MAILIRKTGIHGAGAKLMDFVDAQRQIDAIMKTLNEAKNSSALGPNDPAVVELERIMLTRVAELEAAKTEAREARPKSTDENEKRPR
jgi:hypothetical protein